MQSDADNAAAPVVLSIGTRLALALVALIALLSIGVYVALSEHERAALLDAKQRAATMMLDLLVETLAAPVVFGDDAGVQEALDFLRHNPDVVEAKVYRLDAGMVGALLGQYRASDEPNTQIAPRFDRLDSLSAEGGDLRGTFGVRDKERRLVAVAYVRFSLAREERAFRELSLRIFEVSLVVALSAMALCIFLARRFIVRPLRTLSRAARALEAGQPAILPAGARDEIGQLAQRFSRMAGAIAAREQAIAQKNETMRLVLENVGQGFLTLDESGAIVGQHSSVTTAWFGEPTPGQKLWELLKPHDPEQSEWLELVWANIGAAHMPLALCIEQLPRRFGAGGRTYDFEFRPMLHDRESLAQMVLVVSDVTDLVARERAEEEQRELVAVLNRLIGDRAGFRAFYEEATRTVRAIENAREPDLTALLRGVHTLKGNAALFEMRSVASACVCIEQEASARGQVSLEVRAALAAAFARIARVVDGYLGEGAPTLELSEAEYGELLAAIDAREPYARLRDRLASFADEPVTRALMRLSERMHVLSRRLGKGDAVRIEVRPSTLRLPPALLGQLAAALLHLAHNAIDHGVEGSEERAQSDKPSPARIVLSAEREGGDIVVRIADDGRGIDWARVRARARERGLPADTQAALERALFSDGLTTAREVSEVSGRGVGLAAATQLIEEIGARLTLHSEAGRGTTVEIRLAVALVRAA